MPTQKWVTVMTHRSYEIQINQVRSSLRPHGFGYRINDPAFLPDYKRYDSVAEAIQVIDEASK